MYVRYIDFSGTYFIWAVSYSSLEFGTIPSAEPGAPPTVTNDILAMISPEKESVTLQKVRTSVSLYKFILVCVHCSSSWMTMILFSVASEGERQCRELARSGGGVYGGLSEEAF